MGGLLSKLKITGTTFIIASLAIAGIPPFAGFWSKDEILSEALHSGHPVLFAIGVFTSILTAFYIFRMIFLVLFGKTRSELAAHESPKVMTIPLSILAVFSIFIGFIGSPLTHYSFQNFLHPQETSLLALPQVNYLALSFSIFAAFLGIGLAYTIHLRNNKILGASLRGKFSFLYRILYNKYYIDELYEFVFIRPFISFSKLSFRFDSSIIDGAVNGTAKVTVMISKVKFWFDLYIIDAVVNLTAKMIGLFSRLLRLVQTGLVQFYLLIAFLGLVTIIFLKFMGGI